MNEGKNVILSHEQQTLNNFIIFQKKYFNKIGDEEYDAFKRKYSENLFVVPILFGIFFSLYLLFHKSRSANEIFFYVILLIFAKIGKIRGARIFFLDRLELFYDI